MLVVVAVRVAVLVEVLVLVDVCDGVLELVCVEVVVTVCTWVRVADDVPVKVGVRLIVDVWDCVGEGVFDGVSVPVKLGVAEEVAGVGVLRSTTHGSGWISTTQSAALSLS